MPSREQIRQEFEVAKEMDMSGKIEVFDCRRDMMKRHLDNLSINPEQYEGLTDESGRPLFNFQGLYNSWSKEKPYENYNTPKRVFSNKSTDEMINDVLVEVPVVPKTKLVTVVEDMQKVNDLDV